MLGVGGGSTGDESDVAAEVFDPASIRSIAAQGDEAGYAADVIAAAVRFTSAAPPLHALTYERLGDAGRRGWRVVCSCGWRGGRKGVNGGARQG